MQRIAFDSETWLIQPGRLAPPPVCFTFDSGEAPATIHLASEGLDILEALLRDPTVVLLGQNLAFDFGVACNARPTLLRAVFDAYDAGRIEDVRIRDKLLLLAAGRLKDEEGGAPTRSGLDDIVRRRFSVDLGESKHGTDAWRLRYSELDGVPLAEWPEEAVSYAKDDATWVRRIYEDQERDRAEWVIVNDGEDVLADQAAQTRCAWDLHLMAMWGVRVDAGAVAALEGRLTASVEAANERLRKLGFLKGKVVKHQDGTTEVGWAKDLKAIRARVEKVYGDAERDVPQTEKGATSTDGDTLTESGDPDLLVLAESAADAKLLSTYVPALKAGVGAPINAGWNELLATGRTSSYKPNLQNPPKKGGVRECFVPRPGYLYLSADYSTIELCAWAQVCLELLGQSTMAEAIRAGRDLHIDMAVDILRSYGDQRLTYKDSDYDIVLAARKARESWAVDARQMAKAANFGFPGGLGPATFVQYARATYDVRLTENEASNLREVWRAKWPESQDYRNYISALSPMGGEFAIRQIRSGRVRGGCTFTSASNGFFQSLAADGAKAAMREIQRRCYLPAPGRESALFASRLVLFLHDEFILEVPESGAHDAAQELVEVMVDKMRIYIPDVPVKAEPALMRRWCKEAEAVYDKKARLIPWEPS